MCEFVNRDDDEVIIRIFCGEELHIFYCGVVFLYPFEHVVLWQVEAYLLCLHIFEHVEVIVHVVDDALRVWGQWCFVFW